MAENYVDNYFVKDVLPVAQSCVIGGLSKTLKTSIAIDLALSVATGSPFLGRYKVDRKANVAFFSAESGKATIQDTVKRIVRQKQIDPAKAPIHWSFVAPKLSDAEHLDAIERFVVEKKIGVCFIDPLYLCLLDAESANQASNMYAMGSRLVGLSDIIARTGCTIVVLHHFRKGGGIDDKYEQPELEQLAMSGCAEWMRSWVLIRRREQWVPGEPHRLWMSIGGSAGHASQIALEINAGELDDVEGRKWELMIQDAVTARAGAKLTKVTVNAAKIKTALEESPTPMSERRLRKESGLGEAAFKTAADYLTDPARNIVQTIKGRHRGNLCTLYGLAERHGDLETWSDPETTPDKAAQTSKAKPKSKTSGGPKSE